jgi:hypothetical protein
MDVIKCSRCHQILAEHGGKKCPYCGETRREIFASFNDVLVPKQDHLCGITAGNTGRYASHSNSRNPTDVPIIQEHINDFVAGKIAPLEKYLDDLVAAFSSIVSNESITLYRGIDASIKLDGQQIGPSPHSSEGRYNESGERCLYLIDNDAFLPSEINASNIFVQKYSIPLSELHIADLSSTNQSIDNSLAIIFQFTERGWTDSGLNFEDEFRAMGKSEYLLSQYVAHVFKNHGWQGLYVPGVHGKSGDTYTNLALFGDCIDRWKKWAIGDYYRRG